jgi:hypothetical protein
MSKANAIPSLKLRCPRLGRIAKGGYVIGYEGTLPPGMTLWLGLPDLSNALEVTGRDKNDLLDASNLPTFLSLIGKQENWWGGNGKCRLFVKSGESVVGESNIEEFACPVRPFVGPLTPKHLGRRDPGPKFNYTGTRPKYPDGRVLFMPAIDGCYYFAYGGKFETDNKKRGFNCITYVGAVFGIDVNTGAMSSYGTQLAKHCGCTPSGCENETLLEAKTFLKNKKRGTYLMWSEHHIVVVVNGFVHEFREKLRGYNTQRVDEWEHKDNRWWVRRSARQF